MLGLLIPIFLEYGLGSNASKTKILSDESPSDQSTYCITEYGYVEIMSATQKHKYLGRVFSGGVRSRGSIVVEHRISCAWMKYKGSQHILEDRHIPVQLRLTLFDATISSTVLCALETCPLTEKLLSRLDVVQRTIIRRMVGWIYSATESWEEIRHRMKHRVQKCSELHPILDWSETIGKRKMSLVSAINEAPLWTVSAFEWDPTECSSANVHIARRFRGRPFSRLHNN